MASSNLENLVKLHKLEIHPPQKAEIEGHLQTAKDLLKTARLPGVPASARFLNLYEAAHAVALAGVKLAGYRSKDGEGNRQTALSLIEQTLAVRKGVAAAFTEANRLRINSLYHGSEVDPPDAMIEMLGLGVEDALKEIPIRLKTLS
jgi:hypothetical protein